MRKSAKRRVRWHQGAGGLIAGVCATTCLVQIPSALGQNEAVPVRTFELRVENGRLVKGEKTIRVVQGDSLILRWVADRRTVVHLHGYDIESTIGPSPTEMALTARLTGRFPVETHPDKNAGAQAHHHVLIYVEVHPR